MTYPHKNSCRQLILVVLATWVLLSGSAYGQSTENTQRIYKWKDDKGSTQITNQQPEAGVAYQTITMSTSRTNNAVSSAQQPVVTQATGTQPLPGLWAMSMNTHVAADSGWNPPPFVHRQCITAQDANNPSGLISAISNPGATACTYGDKSYVNGVFRFSLTCEGAYKFRASGSMTFNAQSFSGNFTAIGALNGQPVTFTNAIQGYREGDCQGRIP
ncbi:MAG: DUF3617 family protein [Magnetococcales bacterium]|nr:DUF3617 family protein [Magnetococcales bacterium]